mmetsp:Transcript_15735/g.25168  ORF Transcript_15735/g.25168 Transcript_15735/m.25168 type:complete len:95 (-) Transcript_15735:886-1170(-)
MSPHQLYLALKKLKNVSSSSFWMAASLSRVCVLLVLCACFYYECCHYCSRGKVKMSFRHIQRKQRFQSYSKISRMHRLFISSKDKAAFKVLLSG